MIGAAPSPSRVNEERKLKLHKQEDTRPAGGGVKWGTLPWLLCTKHRQGAGRGHQTETYIQQRRGEKLQALVLRWVLERERGHFTALLRDIRVQGDP